jgi:hypothetical protein
MSTLDETIAGELERRGWLPRAGAMGSVSSSWRTTPAIGDVALEVLAFAGW